MSDFQKGKLFGTFLNKHRLSFFDKIRYAWVITLIPFFLFLYSLFYNLQLTLRISSIVAIYFSAYIFLDLRLSSLKMKELIKTIPKEVLLYFPNESTLSMLIIYPLLGQPGSLFAGRWSFSKDFWNGFRETYWAMKLYFITILFIIVPAFIFTLIIFGNLLLTIYSP